MATTGIHHLGLSVSNLDQTTAFFTDCLGWKLVREVPEYPARFVSNGTSFFTLWQTDPSAAPFDRRANVGLHHVAISITNEAEMDALFAKIRAYPGTRVEFAPQLLRDGPAKHCMFFEPSGIRMELIWAPAA